MSDEHDHQMAAGLQAGKGEAWAALYEEYFDRVWQLAARLTGPDLAVVADVVQETFLAAAKNVQATGDFLAKRPSLGWSDLDKVFESALGRCGPRTKVVYVGDGVVTTGDGDPVAFAKRLKLLYKDKVRGLGCQAPLQPAFYAVSVGSTYESGILKAIASLGKGSMRQITSQQQPRAMALELLEEIARPPLRDLKVEFRGLTTARVYPEELPNLPAGSQQILLGRYLPQGVDQSGEVIITGSRAGQPVRYSSRISLKDADDGNSFVPRLWARMHLDFLLAQGPSQAVKDEIIALSEQYHIMTPYTSLLVLENDADRERFKVTRHFQMRDGERFFAQGRDNVNYELTQQQMKRAGTWRLGLRRAVLRQFSGLGRDSLDMISLIDVRTMPNRDGRLSLPGNSRVTNVYDIRDLIVSVPNFNRASGSNVFDTGLSSGSSVFGGSQSGVFGTATGGEAHYLKTKSESADDGQPIDRNSDLDPLDAAGEAAAEGPPVSDGPDRAFSLSEDIGQASYAGSSVFGSGYYDVPYYLQAGNREFPRAASDGWLATTGYWPSEGNDESTQWLDVLFPQLVTPDRGPLPETMAPDRRWPAEARAISDSLLRRPALAAIKGGLIVDQQDDVLNIRTGQLDRRDRSIKLLSPTAWLFRIENNAEQTTIQWCDAKERGVFNKGFMLGRVRPVAAGDLPDRPLDFFSYAWETLERMHQESTVEVKPQGECRTLLVLTERDTKPESQYRVLVDTVRHVVLSEETVREGKVVSTGKYSDFVEVGGAWWPTREESFDEKGRLTNKTTFKVVAATAEEFDKRFQAQLADRPKVQFLAEPARKLSASKRAAALGKADFDDEMTLLLHFARSQQWARVMQHLDAAERLGVLYRGALRRTLANGTNWLRPFGRCRPRHGPPASTTLRSRSAISSANLRPGEIRPRASQGNVDSSLRRQACSAHCRTQTR